MGWGKPRTPRKHLDPVQEGRGGRDRSAAPAGSPQSGGESREQKQGGGGEVFRESSQAEPKDRESGREDLVLREHGV